jgi:hypothetical protein
MEMLETLLAGVRSACATFPDKRRGDVTYSMADIGLSAFSPPCCMDRRTERCGIE